MSTGELVIEDLRAGIPGREILQGLTLTVRSGEVHAVMGPNGSGKSTLAHVLMGRPGYEVLGGSVTLDGVDLLALPTWQRARAGLFLAMQHPIEVPGVSLVESLTAARHADLPTRRPGTHRTWRRDCTPRPPGSASTSASSTVRSTSTCRAASASGTRPCSWASSGPGSPCSTRSTRASTSTPWPTSAAGSRRPPTEWGLGVLAITHFRRLLDVLPPDVVHVLAAGRVVATGGSELAEVVDRTGYAAYT